MVDLHAHTTASDGSYAPRDLVTLAKERGLDAVGVTDHDTIGGWDEALAAGRELGVEIVPGVELSTAYEGGRFHMLGYYISADSRLGEELLMLQRERANRNDIIIENLAVLTVSAQPRTFAVPAYLNQLVPLGGLNVRMIDIAIVLLAIVLMIALVLFVRFTKIGVAMRATAENYDVARLMGININRMIGIAFAIGSALAAVAGLMWGTKYGQISPLMGVLPGLKAFVAAVIGGVGSITGAVLGGYVLGMAEVLFVGLLPPEYSGYRNAFVFGALILVLLVMPNGILGRSTEQRA